jgi:hypothetical protein
MIVNLLSTDDTCLSLPNLAMWSAVPLNETVTAHIDAGIVSYHYVDQTLVRRHKGFQPQLQVGFLPPSPGNAVTLTPAPLPNLTAIDIKHKAHTWKLFSRGHSLSKAAFAYPGCSQRLRRSMKCNMDGNALPVAGVRHVPAGVSAQACVDGIHRLRRVCRHEGPAARSAHTSSGTASPQSCHNVSLRREATRMSVIDHVLLRGEVAVLKQA